MTTFEGYYRELQRREEFKDFDLIAIWEKADVQAVGDDLAQAVQAGGLKTQTIPIRPNSTNQSIGNQVEQFFVERIKGYLKNFDLQPCSGAGYPDKQLSHKCSGRKFVLEVKATSSWDALDTNRVVLTSSSKKLRTHFTPPINHLLVTICYSAMAGPYRVTVVRLDFIQPGTEVNIRLEASVSHRILAAGTHPSREI
jgi:hypothetical protein